jgi:hypothetical protein
MTKQSDKIVDLGDEQNNLVETPIRCFNVQKSGVKIGFFE